MDAKPTTKVDILEGLGSDEHERLVSSCRVLPLERGMRIFSEGDPGDELYIVRTGRVRIWKAISRTADRTLAIVGQGAVFGELAVFDTGPRSANAEALETSVVLALSRAAFFALTEERPWLGNKLLLRFTRTLGERLRLTNDLLRDAVAWGLQVSGAQRLDLGKIVTLHPDVSITLATGKEVSGRLLRVASSEGGVEVTVQERDGRLLVVPWHAVVALGFPAELLAGAASGEA